MILTNQKNSFYSIASKVYIVTATLSLLRISTVSLELWKNGPTRLLMTCNNGSRPTRITLRFVYNKPVSVNLSSCGIFDTGAIANKRSLLARARQRLKPLVPPTLWYLV